MAAPALRHVVEIKSLHPDRPTPLDWRLSADETAHLASILDIQGLRKVAFRGAVQPLGQTDWALTAHIGATAIQSCVISLAPVTTRIDERVQRTYLAGYCLPQGAGEFELPQEDEAEPLGSEIDLAPILIDAIALALPAYPRAEGAELETSTFTAPGTAPLTDEDVKPFAALGGLRAALEHRDASGEKPDAPSPRNGKKPKDDTSSQR